ncbi:endonuclease III domain-containing protein [Hydrogenobacter hydrogenophilus]|uniref:Endonuclease III n=1 Tax=Hydrogenobacter hydrogenophilus TaxID=35835 RepID=A0A285P5E4_9AQUI|nr:endonuclease III [Hydrogenobacter hydrogenophilus]SNZ15376.1 endonuclease-3 [Hydrogenobacter hydrogenophilus]
MRKEDLDKVIGILREEFPKWNAPVVSLIAQKTGDPFRVLVCALISTRTKDETTAMVCKRLFERIKSVEDLYLIDKDELSELLYPVGFYKNKALFLKEIAKELKEKYNSKVPDKLEELLKLKGVGRKVANLVLAEGYGIPAICVDTHVHRITNRWCLVKTKKPEETERQLTKILPKKYWIEFNKLLVAFGQTICKPVKPLCHICPIREYCEYPEAKMQTRAS